MSEKCPVLPSNPHTPPSVDALRSEGETCTHDEPIQPLLKHWRFVEELRSPLWVRHNWLKRVACAGEVYVGNGIAYRADYSDPNLLLESATKDLEEFCTAGEIPWGKGYPIAARLALGGPPESFRIDVTQNGCELIASDLEGIRRGIFQLEEMMLSAGGPFLPLGSMERSFTVRSRISRCFFGPIKRPPMKRDELMDDIDYYPEHYLNRLAHDGVNVLWISISFRDLCRNPFFPSHGTDARQRLAKLRRTVASCARYGIRVYGFTIEPCAFGQNYFSDKQKTPEDLVRNPEMAGHRQGDTRYFCTSSPEGLDYVEQAMATLFREVPGLGGLINICYGEGATHCYSSGDGMLKNNCPRCSKRPPEEVYAELLSAMARGMHSVNPDAELVAWLYVSQIREHPDCDPNAVKDVMRRIAAHVPSSVTLQFNFESNGEELQLGKVRPVLDYTLAHVGPSDLFRDCATAAVRAGASMSAKLQVGCSHEVATIPFVPVPGNIYRKYKILRELGATCVMQSWFFGNYPSLMTRAAGRCSQSPFPESEEAFLHELAAPQWGKHAPIVVKAWQKFRDAYNQFPANRQFAHYSPVHDCIAWPLHLQPVDLPIAPSWQLGHSVSGDRIGECFAYTHTLEEILILCQRVCDGWDEGLRILSPLANQVRKSPENLQEIRVAEALGLQFRSALHVLTFYSLREELPWQSPTEQASTLSKMKSLAEEELHASRQLAVLADQDSRLGFHSEAEGYKYFPSKLRWRAGRIQAMLDDEFPEVEEHIEKGRPVFAEFAGIEPRGPMYHCKVRADFKMGHLPWKEADLVSVPGGERGGAFEWQGLANEDTLFLRAICWLDHPDLASTIPAESFFDHDRIRFNIEPRRLWPTHELHADADGTRFHDNRGATMDHRWKAHSLRRADCWETVLEVPLVCVRNPDLPGRPMRINVERILPDGSMVGWILRTETHKRLHFGNDNSRDLGWLLFSA
jgi:hypothetical protein